VEKDNEVLELKNQIDNLNHKHSMQEKSVLQEMDEFKAELEAKNKKIDQLKNSCSEAENEVKSVQTQLDGFKAQFGGNLDNFMRMKAELEAQVDGLKRELRVKQVDFESLANETDEKLKDWRQLKHENENQAIEIEELNKKVN